MEMDIDCEIVKNHLRISELLYTDQRRIHILTKHRSSRPEVFYKKGVL